MIERRIVTGLIVSTEYMQSVRGTWNAQLLVSETARRIAAWCWEYFEAYGKAPGKNIESVFYEKIKDVRFPKEVAEEIEQEILPGLSKEYENSDFNLQYLVRDTEKYFAERHIKVYHETVERLLEAGETSEAEKLIVSFKPLSVSANSLDNYISSVHKIRGERRVQPRRLLEPWLREGQTTIIYGNYGSGKSLLTLAIAYVLGLKECEGDESRISTWEVRNPTGTLYVDGELGEQEMAARISQFEWLGEQRYRTRILSIPEYQIATEDAFYLSLRINQLKIVKWLKDHPNYKLLVLDSASTLFGLKDENDNSEWNDKINPFLRDLRALGVACLLLHHSGKDGKRGLRGASSMGAMAHNIFVLSNHREKNNDDGEAWFTLKKDKQRAAGFSFRSFALRFFQTEDGKETHWKVTQMQ